MCCAVTSDRGAAADRGQIQVDGLVHLLDLERIEDSIFRGVSPTVSLPRVFGGQVAGQALVAAGRTVDPAFAVHSLHAYFIRGGDPAVPIVYIVDPVRDGRSFCVRRVAAVQHGKAIFTLSASFQLDERGLEFGQPMPAVPAPLSLPSYGELLDRTPGLERLSRLPRPIEMRFVDDPPWRRGATAAGEPQMIWMRAAGRLPDDPLVHVCAVTFASDLTLLDAVLLPHGLSFVLDGVTGASLDHAMWFHRAFRADEWFLYVSEPVSTSGGRGLAGGRIHSADGHHVVTVVQEGLMRLPAPPDRG